MSFVAHALLLFVAQTTPAFDRAESLLQHSQGFHSTVKITFAAQKGFSGQYSCRSGHLQRFRIVGPGLEEELLQSKDASIYFDHEAKEYLLEPRFEGVAEAPKESSAVMQLGLPVMFARKSLKALSQKWMESGNEIVGGLDCVILNGTAGSKPGADDPFRVWIDSTGKLRRFEATVFRQEGPLRCSVEFVDPTYEALPSTHYETELPWGYVPSEFPNYHDTKVSGDSVTPMSCLRWPSAEPAQLTLKNPVVVLFSSNEMQDETSSEQWEALASDCKKKNIRFVQVWLGEKPHNHTVQWEMFWDKNGEVDKHFSPPFTPYLLAINDSVIVGGWQGKNDGKATSEALLKAFERH